MNKINIKEIDRKTGFDTHDDLRVSPSDDLDPIKVSAVIKVVVDIINDLQESIVKLEKELFRTQKSNRVIKRKIKKL